MASAGIPDSIIMIMGRWSSNCYQQYLRLSDHILTSVTGTMSRTRLISKTWDIDVLQSRPSVTGNLADQFGGAKY